MVSQQISDPESDLKYTWTFVININVTKRLRKNPKNGIHFHVKFINYLN